MSLTSGGNDMCTNTVSNDYCGWCSNPPNHLVYHFGPCPRVRALEYHPNGQLKRVEFGPKDAADRASRRPKPVLEELVQYDVPPDGYNG